MSRSSEYHLGASSSSPTFRKFGEFSDEEEPDVIAKKKKATIEQQQQQKLMVEPDVPKMQGVEAENAFSNYGPWNESESGHGVMSYAVLIMLVVAEVILGLDFFGVI